MQCAYCELTVTWISYHHQLDDYVCRECERELNEQKKSPKQDDEYEEIDFRKLA